VLVTADVTSKYWLETRWTYLCEVISLLKERMTRVSDIVELGSYFFDNDFTYEEKADAKQFTPEAAEILQALADRFATLSELTHENTEAALNALADEMGLKKGKLIHPTRLAVSGISKGPGLYDLLVTLTKQVVLDRMYKAIEYIKAKPTA
jgi:glutamyl-tRNA synthetase